MCQKLLGNVSVALQSYCFVYVIYFISITYYSSNEKIFFIDKILYHVWLLSLLYTIGVLDTHCICIASRFINDSNCQICKQNQKINYPNTRQYRVYTNIDLLLTHRETSVYLILFD